MEISAPWGSAVQGLGVLTSFHTWSYIYIDVLRGCWNSLENFRKNNAEEIGGWEWNKGGGGKKANKK